MNSGSGNITISNTTVDADADAVHFDTGSNGDSGSGAVLVAEAKYNRWDGELDSDESKRVLILGMDIDTLDDNTEIQVRIYDESGSYKEVNASTGYSSQSVNATAFAAGTNDVFYQVKLSALTTEGADTSFDNIENVTVRVYRNSGSTGDADFSISALDLRRKSKVTIGEKRATTDDDGNDPDSDSDYDEIQTVYNASGSVSIYDLTTMDTLFDSAIINDISYQYHYVSSGNALRGEDGNYVFEFEEASNPGFNKTLNLTVSQKLPSATDLSYSNSKTEFVQKWPEARYLTVESASGVASSVNLSQASFSSLSSSLGSQGSTVTVDATTTAGERIVWHVEVELTGDEVDTVKAASDSGSGVAPPDSGDGGSQGIGGMIVDFFTSLTGIAATVLAGTLVWMRRRGK
ncbi:MAG: hypothetical protein U5J98_06990 [Halobacteriales archaeon]|nr:hypothetical protein [Halobacteriales archaeon]